jgi:large subunit ribosomal protein L4e
VFEAEKRKQPHGAMPGAGAGYSASGKLRHRRHRWKTTYGRGISRIPRKIMSSSGSSFNWIGATISSTVGGRRAHPPRADKNQFKKINKKEFVFALDSAFTGCVNKKALEEKYEEIKNLPELPVVVNSQILETKSKEFFEILKKIFKENFEKIIQKKKIRAGKGKLRGRKYKKNTGLLFVMGSEEKMKRTGIDVVNVSELKIKDLAPNGVAGRFVCYTEKAIKEIEEKFGGGK